MAAPMKTSVFTAFKCFRRFSVYFNATRIRKGFILTKYFNKPHLFGFENEESLFKKNKTFCTETGTVKKCWKCGRPVNRSKHVFFCDCDIILEPESTLDYFQLLSTKTSFTQDLVKLNETYKNLQKQLHPDKFSQKSEMERHLSEKQSSLVNKAYNTLKHPMSRGLYMLKLYGEGLQEGEIQIDPDFLMEILEINETLAQTNDKTIILEIGQTNHKHMTGLMYILSQAFDNADIPQAKSILAQLKYFANIHDKVENMKMEYGWGID